MPLNERPDLSKAAQVARSPGGNRRCPTTGELKADCGCATCRGWRNRRKGAGAQRRERKALDRLSGGPVVSSQAQGSQEEWWRGVVRVEVKSGKQVESLTRRFLAAEAQSEAQKAIGDSRPFVFAAVPDSFGGDAIWAVRRSDLLALIDAIRGQ